MTLFRWLPLAALMLPLATLAQSTSRCPELPAASGVSWQVMDGPDFTFCKAMRDGDGSQAFAVMLRAESTFRPNRSLREQEMTIDGHEVYWYRGELALEPNAIVRETLLELGNDNTAHISLRATSEDQLAETQQLIQGLRFGDARLGSN